MNIKKLLTTLNLTNMDELIKAWKGWRIEIEQVYGSDHDGVTDYSEFSTYDWSVDISEIIKEQCMGWLTGDADMKYSQIYIEDITPEKMSIHFTCGYAIDLSWQRMSYGYHYSFGRGDYTDKISIVPEHKVQKKIAKYEGQKVHWYHLCLDRLKISQMAPVPENLYSADLGLSVYWAPFNIGANKPEEFGCRFAWGMTVPNKEGYGYWRGLKDDNGKDMFNGKGDSDYHFSGLKEYDAATAIWGKGWRVPTPEEVKELLYKCTWQWTTENGQTGYKVTGPTGEWIFLPLDMDSQDVFGRSGTIYWVADAYMQPGGSTRGTTLELCNYINGKYDNYHIYDSSTESRYFIRPVCDKK